jgi:gluconokinase
MAPGVAGMSLGTSGAVRMAVDQPHVDDGRTLFCYALTESTWVLGAAISTGGLAVRWAEEALAPDLADDAAVLEAAAAVAPGCDGLVMLPYLLAERAPLWDPDLPGAFLGLRRRHTRGHLLRAAVEGVCLQMRLIVDRLDDVEAVDSLRVTGGVFRSTLWRDVMAAMLGRPLHMVGDAEGTALGAAALGLFALGRVEALTDGVGRLSGSGSSVSDVVEPEPELVSAYDKLRESVPALLGGLDQVAALFEAERSGSGAGARR